MIVCKDDWDDWEYKETLGVGQQKPLHSSYTSCMPHTLHQSIHTVVQARLLPSNCSTALIKHVKLLPTFLLPLLTLDCAVLFTAT